MSLKMSLQKFIDDSEARVRFWLLEHSNETLFRVHVEWMHKKNESHMWEKILSVNSSTKGGYKASREQREEQREKQVRRRESSWSLRDDRRRGACRQGTTGEVRVRSGVCERPVRRSRLPEARERSAVHYRATAGARPRARPGPCPRAGPGAGGRVGTVEAFREREVGALWEWMAHVVREPARNEAHVAQRRHALCELPHLQTITLLVLILSN